MGVHEPRLHRRGRGHDGHRPTANVDLDPGETATCTYTNSRKGSIVVQKQTSPDGDPQVFAFSASYDATASR